MKLRCVILVVFLAAFALTEGRPRRAQKFTKLNSGSTGQAEGSDTAVDTESKAEAADAATYALAKGQGSASGQDLSSADIESWAGIEGLLEASAGGGGKAEGEKTAVLTDSEVFINEDMAEAEANSAAEAKGRGKSAAIMESFADLEQWGSATANGEGSATGDLSEVKSESLVKSKAGQGTMARSSGKGAAIGKSKLGLVKLENFAGIDDGPSGKADATSIGNKAGGKTAICTTNGADGSIVVCSGSEAEAEASGRGGSRTAADASDGESLAVNAGSQGRGQGDQVLTKSASNSGLTDSEAAGRAHTATKTRGKKLSFSESVSDVVIDEYVNEEADNSANADDC